MTSRFPALAAALCAPVLLAAGACARGDNSAGTTGRFSARDSTAVADSLRSLVRDAYDLSRGDVVARMMSLYPARGRVVSATAGRVTTTRDSLEQAVHAFWEGVGQYMVRPTWQWGEMSVDVLTPGYAVMTAEYIVPHWTERGNAHVIGGVWTTVWRRGSDGWRVVHEHLSDLPRAAAEELEAQIPADSAATHAHRE